MRAKGKKFKKRYLVIILILLVGGMAGWRMINAPLPTYQTLIVRPGDLEQSVLATENWTRCVKWMSARR